MDRQEIIDILEEISKERKGKTKKELEDKMNDEVQKTMEKDFMDFIQNHCSK